MTINVGIATPQLSFLHIVMRHSFDVWEASRAAESEEIQGNKPRLAHVEKRCCFFDCEHQIRVKLDIGERNMLQPVGCRGDT